MIDEMEKNNSPNPLGTPFAPGSGSPGTFAGMSYEQQEAFLDAQFRQEGNKPGNLAYDLKNPGAMLYASWQKQFGAIPNMERGTVSKDGKKVPFAEFPTLIQGRQAQRYLWSTTYANKNIAQSVATWSGENIGTTNHSNYMAAVTGKNPIPISASPYSANIPFITSQNQNAWQNYSVVRNTNSSTTNVVNNGRKTTGADADPYDQLFAMLFMDKPVVQ
jgi:hypothetical protein